MFENILIITLAYMLAAICAEKFEFLSLKFSQWQKKHAFYRDFNRRKKEIKRQNRQTVIDCISFKIEENFRYFNEYKRPKASRLARMIKREYEQMKDYGMFDEMNRCRYEITL